MNLHTNLLITLLAFIPATSRLQPSRSRKPTSTNTPSMLCQFPRPALQRSVFRGRFPQLMPPLSRQTAKRRPCFNWRISPTPTSFSVRSLAKEGTTNVNVRWNNRTYVLELDVSDAPVLSLIFRQPTDNSKDSLLYRPVTPGILLGLLDKAKAYAVLKTSHPDAVESVDYVNYEPKPPVMDYNDFEIRLEEAFRFDPEDTLVFRVVLRNKTGKEILYRPQGFSLRVGKRLYSQSISDASGVMPPKSDSPAYFAVTGTPDGGRNDISIKNEFTVLLARLDAETTQAVQSVPLDNQKGFAK